MQGAEWVSQEFVRCTPWLQSALDRAAGEYLIEHVWQAIEEGRAQLWPMPDACAVTVIDEYPTGLKVCRCWLAGGDLKQIVASEAHIATWARQQGCQQFRSWGRKGWLRAFQGFRELYTVIAKELQ